MNKSNFLAEQASSGQSEKIERTLNSGRGTGELSFFFGMRHLGNIL